MASLSEIEDCTRTWTFAPDSAHFIHMRWPLGSIPDWVPLFAEAHKACRPGGWVESVETSAQVHSDHIEIPKDSAMAQWGEFWIEGGKQLGRTAKVVDDDLQRKGMEAAGFVDIQEKAFKVRWISWKSGGRHVLDALARHSTTCVNET